MSKAVQSIESLGIQSIPVSEQTARPSSTVVVLIGANLSFTAFVFGWIPITLGLSFGNSVLATLVGVTLGSLLSAVLALAGPTSRTTNTVSSGALFGIRGRVVGVFVTLLVSIFYAGISIWTGGDALSSALSILDSSSNGQLLQLIGYAVMLCLVAIIAIYGHRLMLRAQGVMLAILAICVALVLFAVAPSVDVSYPGGEFALGELFPTWALAVAIAASGPLSYAPYLSDYTRYVSGKTNSNKSIYGWSFLALAGSLTIAGVSGSYLALAIADPAADFVPGLFASVPAWALIPLLVFGLLGGVSQGAVSLYDAGLQMQAIFSRLGRSSATVIASALAAMLVAFGVAQSETAGLVGTAVLFLNALIVPWIVISAIGYFKLRGQFDVESLHTRGSYWFFFGWNPAAVTAWLVGSVAGILFIQTEIWFGPLAELASGIDISIAVATLLTAATYSLLGGLASPTKARGAAK